MHRGAHLLVVVVSLATTCAACAAPRPAAVVVTMGERIPAQLAGRSRAALARYFTREATFSDAGISLSLTAILLDRAYVVAAQRTRARVVGWPRAHARQELARALAYYNEGRLAFDVRAAAAFEQPVSDAHFLDLAGWQWTLGTDAPEPLVSTDAVTTAKRSWTEQGGGSYFQGRYYVPEPIYVVRRYETRGVVRFGPPAPTLGRELVLRAYPPGVPSVLRLRWRVASRTRS